MKKIWILLIVFATGFISSCDELGDALSFNKEYEKTFTIPATEVPRDTSIEISQIETNLEEHLGDNDSDTTIKEIYLSKLELTISEPQGGDFSFLDTVEVFLNAEGLEETKVASIGVTQESVDTLSMETTSANLKDYLMKEYIDLRVVLDANKAIEEDHLVNVLAVFEVKSELLKEEEEVEE